MALPPSPGSRTHGPPLSCKRSAHHQHFGARSFLKLIYSFYRTQPNWLFAPYSMLPIIIRQKLDAPSADLSRAFSAVTLIRSPLRNPRFFDFMSFLPAERLFIFEIVCAFVWREGVEDFSDLVPQSVDRAFSRFSQKCFDFGEHLLDWRCGPTAPCGCRDYPSPQCRLVLSLERETVRHKQ